MSIIPYELFTAGFLDAKAPVTLCSLRVGDIDLGPYTRFILPKHAFASPLQVSGRSEWVQVQFVRLLDPTRHPGLNARRILIDPVSRRWRAGAWKVLESSVRELKRLPAPSRWLGRDMPLSELVVPPSVDSSSSYELIDGTLVYDTYAQHRRSLHWADVNWIVLEKYASGPPGHEVPGRRLVLAAGEEHVLKPPASVEAPLYQVLCQRFGISEEAIAAVLAAEVPRGCQLWSRVPRITMTGSQCLDGGRSAQCLWNWLQHGASGPLEVGPLRISNATAGGHSGPLRRFTPREVWFEFSGIGDATDKADVVQALQGLKVQGTDQLEVRPDWSQVLEWRSDELTMTLYFGQHGRGCLELSADEYLRRLRTSAAERNRPEQIDVDADEALPLASELSGFDLDHMGAHLSPRRDAPTSLQGAVLWRAGEHWGISHDVWSLSWRTGDLAELAHSDSDFLRDRGGPYEHLQIILRDGASICLDTKGQFDMEAIRYFLRMPEVGAERYGYTA